MLPTVSRLLSKRFKLSGRYFCSKSKIKISFPWFAREICNGLTYCKHAQLYSTLKQSVVHDLCADIQLSELKAKHKCEAESFSLADAVQAEVDQRLNQAIQQLDEQQLRFLKIVQLEHSFLFSEGYSIPAPEDLTNRNWLEAMTMSSMDERLAYYCNLEQIAKKRKIEREKRMEQVGAESDTDGENSESIFLQSLTSLQKERLMNYRLASAMLHSGYLVIDLGFDEHQLSIDIDPLVSQIWNLYLLNGANPDPFHLIFTNCDFTGPVYRHLLLNCMVNVDFVMATFTEKSHTDILPSENLVYLSSQSKEHLTVFDTNKTYILGAYHDPLVRKKLSFAKARQENLLCQKLPIDQHVKWAHQAHKDLDLDSMVGILLSVRDDGQWKKAFVSVVPMLVNQKV
ncbi:hypothetical protein EGW08_006443 [Elysia chlorotica]|uniref:RNA (guanine-9-)-methyltransferase domain-containing protein 1 n=1 Tax=Elysia chlorotica TaxID=188477 RepID=A0A3S0ZXY5_ELYCH|nr:hypothetical protein EGW08_006443 [Elysia chlorotica]